jgi:hypothetical protein
MVKSKGIGARGWLGEFSLGGNMSFGVREPCGEGNMDGKNRRLNETAVTPRTMRLERVNMRVSTLEPDEELYEKSNAEEAKMMVNPTPENERAGRARM